LQRIFFAALIMALVALPLATASPAFAYNPPLITPPLISLGLSQKNAVILSSLDQVYPMGQYDKDMTYYLTHAGYKVTTLTNTAVTLDFLLTQLNNYSIIIWRTNTYTWKHIEYWFVGQLANSGVETQYASDFAQGWINGNAGILGISLNFFTEHFTSRMLSNVKLMILIASDSNAFAGTFVTAGAQSVIFCNAAVTFGFGLIDDLTTQLVANLATGHSVYDSVYAAVSPFAQNANLEDPLDGSYAPPFWYQGNGALII
jgi:hypothetical protein